MKPEGKQYSHLVPLGSHLPSLCAAPLCRNTAVLPQSRQGGTLSRAVCHKHFHECGKASAWLGELNVLSSVRTDYQRGQPWDVKCAGCRYSSFPFGSRLWASDVLCGSIALRLHILSFFWVRETAAVVCLWGVQNSAGEMEWHWDIWPENWPL